MCDGNHDCNDKSDEDPVMCAQWKCPAGYWKCPSALTCIHDTYVCDDYPHCPGNSNEDEDPTMCAHWNCTGTGHRKCQNGLECVHERYFCDVYIHCSDDSDEDPEVCPQWNCTTNYWKCRSGLKCIHKDFICDGEPNCPDRSDEHKLCNCTKEIDFFCHDGDSSITLQKFSDTLWDICPLVLHQCVVTGLNGTVPQDFCAQTLLFAKKR